MMEMLRNFNKLIKSLNFLVQAFCKMANILVKNMLKVSKIL